MAQKTYIYGLHAVTEAVSNNPSGVERVFLIPEFANKKLQELIVKNKIKTAPLDVKSLPLDVDPHAVHQGVIASFYLEKLIHPYDEFIKNLSVSNNTALVILGEIQDPQNVGAIIRSAAAFGASGVLIPEHNQAQISGAVIKASGGLAFAIPLVSIGNVNNTIRDLKDRKFWIYGLDSAGKQTISDESFDAPTVFIFGNEADGIRMKTKELCDIMLSIPMSKRSESLNVSATAAIALHVWSCKHPHELKTK